MSTVLGDEAMPALLDVVVARLLFSPLFRGDERLDVALLRFLVVARGDRRGGGLVVLPASSIPQRSGDEAALARYPAHEQRLLEARDFFAAIDAHPYEDSDEDSDEDGEPPPQMTGYFPPWENEIYLNLLNKYGQPLQENHRAVMAFQQEFNYRVWSSVTAHPNKFNGAQTTHKTGPRGGKIKSTVYRDWVEANGGKWVGFQWKLLGD